MTRLTIRLSDERHLALKEAAARRGVTIGRLIEESLEFYGIKTGKTAAHLLAQARKRSGLSEDEAMDLAVRETREHRIS